MLLTIRSFPFNAQTDIISLFRMVGFLIFFSLFFFCLVFCKFFFLLFRFFSLFILLCCRFSFVKIVFHSLFFFIFLLKISHFSNESSRSRWKICTDVIYCGFENHKRRFEIVNRMKYVDIHRS